MPFLVFKNDSLGPQKEPGPLCLEGVYLLDEGWDLIEMCFALLDDFDRALLSQFSRGHGIADGWLERIRD